MSERNIIFEDKLENEKKDLRKSLFNKLRDKFPSYKCDIEIPVPYKHIYLHKKSKNILEIWCFKQDIVFYKVLFDKKVKYRECKIQCSNNQFIEVVLEKDNAQNTKDVGIPFVIIEVKSKQPNSHEILAYSKKFEMIKTIFPFCKFIFCVFGKISPRTYRHGVNFDYIISLSSKLEGKELKQLEDNVKELLDKAEKELKRLSEKNLLKQSEIRKINLKE